MGKNNNYIECSKFYTDCDKAIHEFFLWLKNNDNISEYDEENIIIGISLGSIVYQEETKWFMIKGLLYEFFDLNGLYIEPHSLKGETQFGFTYYIRTYFDNHHYTWSGSGDGLRMTRNIAEADGFIKAFEMLERRMSNGDKAE